MHECENTDTRRILAPPQGCLAGAHGLDYHGRIEHLRPPGSSSVSRRTPNKPEGSISPWPHRLAWVLACAAFGLVWVGAMMTTCESGVPLLRAIGDNVLLRRICSLAAGLFFAVCALLVTLTSRAWLQCEAAQFHPAARRLRPMALLAGGAVFLLMVLGTLLRHQYLYAGSGGFGVWGWVKSASGGLIWTWFQFWLGLKLFLAGLTAIGLAWLLVDVLRSVRHQPMIVRRVKVLAALFLLQLVLGAAAWVTNYDWPAWFAKYVWEVGYTVVHQGRLQVVTTTLHSAFGSLTLVASLNLTLWLFRLLKPPWKGRAAVAPWQ